MRRARRLYPLLIAAAVVLGYYESFTVPFLFDDAPSIARQHAVRELSWSTVDATTRPLVQLSLALNYAGGGTNVVGYHVVNLLVHVLGALTLFGIVVCSLASTRLRIRWRDSAPELALAISLIWAMHPLQTESVTYIVQRAESLVGLFYLLTLYGMVRGARSVRSSTWYALAIVACGLGMLTKPVMVTAPLAVLLYDRFFLAGNWGRALRERRGLYAGLAATWIILAVLLAGDNESAATTGFGMPDITVGDYVRTQPGVILHYLRLAFWPSQLVLDYGWPQADDVVAVVLPTLVLSGLLGWTYWRFRAHPPITLLVLLFVVLLAPSSSVIPIQDLAVEHRMYLALAPLVVLATLGGWALIQSAGLRVAIARRVATSVTVGVVALLTGLTIERNRDYRTAIVMWTDVTTKRPANARGFGNLGQALLDDGRFDDAIVALRTAVRLHALYPEAHGNLALALVRDGRFDEAEGAYIESLRLQPDRPETLSNLGNLLVRQGKLDAAITRFERALVIDPAYAEVHFNLALALDRRGRRPDAAKHAAEALRLRPDLDAVFRPSGLLALR